MAEMETVEPTPERLQHDVIERARASKAMPWGDAPPRIVVTASQIGTLLRFKRITKKMHDAGQKLYNEWRAAGLEARVIGVYERSIHGRPNMSDYQAECYLHVHEALRYVRSYHGHLGEAILIDVCCYNLSAADFARFHSKPQLSIPERTGIIFLRLALDALYDHYRERERAK